MSVDISIFARGEFKAVCLPGAKSRGWLEVGVTGNGRDRATFFATDEITLDDMREAFAAMLRENGYWVEKVFPVVSVDDKAGNGPGREERE